MSIRSIDRERKLGHRRIGDEGEVTYKKIATQQIMGSIQLGIEHAIGGLASRLDRDLLIQDFMTVETTVFSADGSAQTPAHNFPKFTFKVYAPVAFRYFRDLFGIKPENFMLSFCGAPLRELSNPGASGSIFYVTSNDEFVMKTVTHKEAEFLQKLLPGYYMNIMQNPRTLLPKFFGLYCYHCNSKNIRLVVMNNLLPSWVSIVEKFDLKGSTYKRKASENERQKAIPTFKDLDFMQLHPEGFYLEQATHSALIKTIQRDCTVLESFRIMDYSLLIGVSNIEQREQAKVDANTEGINEQSTSGIYSVHRQESVRTKKRRVFHSNVMDSIDAHSSSTETKNTDVGGISAINDKGESAVLFIGIIDILQSYQIRKKLEHGFKSMFQDSDSISVHRPDFYAQRFLNFMSNKVFKKGLPEASTVAGDGNLSPQQPP